MGSEFACGGLKIPKRPTLGKHALFPDIRPQETSRRPSGAPGKPRRFHRAPGRPRRLPADSQEPQENPGGSMKLPGSPRTLPGRSQEPQETPGRLPGTQEAPGRTRKPKEAPGPGLDSPLLEAGSHLTRPDSTPGSRFSLETLQLAQSVVQFYNCLNRLGTARIQLQ